MTKDEKIEDIMKSLMSLRKKLKTVNEGIFELEQKIVKIIPVKKKN